MIGNPRSVRTAFLAKLVIWCVLLWSMPATAGTWKLVGTGDAPKLNEALTQVRSLESEIAQALANATPVKLAAFPGPSRVALGESATFYIESAGGIPLCCGVPDGPCGDCRNHVLVSGGRAPFLLVPFGDAILAA